jgi:hypothetical protein
MNIIEELIMCSIGAVFFLATLFVAIILGHDKNKNNIKTKIDNNGRK